MSTDALTTTQTNRPRAVKYDVDSPGDLGHGASPLPDNKESQSSELHWDTKKDGQSSVPELI